MSKNLYAPPRTKLPAEGRPKHRLFWAGVVLAVVAVAALALGFLVAVIGMTQAVSHLHPSGSSVQGVDQAVATISGTSDVITIALGLAVVTGGTALGLIVAWFVRMAWRRMRGAGVALLNRSGVGR